MLDNASDIVEGDDIVKYNGKTIKKRIDGRYWTRYYVNGIQKSVYGRTQKECLANLKKALSIAKKVNNQRKETYTLEQWIIKWKKLYKESTVKRSTMYTMEHKLNMYVLSNPIAKKDIKQINSIELQELLNNIEAPRQREAIKSYFSDMFNKAYQLELIKRNPMTTVTIPKIRKQEGKALSASETKIFVEQAKKDKYADYFLLLLYQGLRPGELEALFVEDIDFENRRMTINKTVSDLGEITTPKTPQSNRIIPIFDNAYEILLKYKDKSGLLFDVKTTTRSRHFQSIMKQCRLYGFTPYSLRHTFFTRCSELGIPEHVFQHWGGHSRGSEITKKYYLHVNDDFEQECAKKINCADTCFDTHFDT